MRIANLRHAAKTIPSKKSERVKSSNGQFGISQEPSATVQHQVGGPSTIANLDAVLALQAVGNERDERAEALCYGREALDLLDELKIGLLTGRISPVKLHKLKRITQARPDFTGNSQLMSVLDQIELRTLVELAKLKQI